MDLLNVSRYGTLGNAIRRWCPWQSGQQQVCLEVQKTLLTLLPVTRQKQELQQLCQDYRNHLAVEVEKEAKNDSEQNYMVSTQKRTLLFGAPPVNERAQVKMVTDSRPSVEKLVDGPDTRCRKTRPTPVFGRTKISSGQRTTSHSQHAGEIRTGTNEGFSCAIQDSTSGH